MISYKYTLVEDETMMNGEVVKTTGVYTKDDASAEEVAKVIKRLAVKGYEVKVAISTKDSKVKLHGSNK